MNPMTYEQMKAMGGVNGLGEHAGKGRDPVAMAQAPPREEILVPVQAVRRGFEKGQIYISPLRTDKTERWTTIGINAREHPWLDVAPYLAPIDNETWRTRYPFSFTDIKDWGGKIEEERFGRKMEDQIPVTESQLLRWDSDVNPKPWAKEGQEFPGPIDEPRGEYTLEGLSDMAGTLSGAFSAISGSVATALVQTGTTALAAQSPSFLKDVVQTGVDLYMERERLKAEEAARKAAAKAPLAVTPPPPSAGLPSWVLPVAIVGGVLVLGGGLLS